MTGIESLSELMDRVRRFTDQTSVDLYDLLPIEDREAIAWVREHGGIAYVKDAWDVRRNLDRQLEKAQAKVERQQRHIEDVQSKLIERNERIAELKSMIDVRERANQQLNDELNAMRQRLMPEGMEWPRFEDGRQVKFRDEGVDVHGETRSVEGVKFSQNGFVFISDGMGVTWWANDRGPIEEAEVDPGKRVKRPAPKVLDADGVEIELGDGLYSVEGCLKLHVSHIDRINGKIATDAMFSLDKWVDPSMYTHRAPVLAADGRPLREGDTVYEADEGTKHVVDHIEYEGGGTPNVYFTDGKWAYPCLLTHDKPDSYDALFDDVIFKGLTREEFVRRAKALAERGA